MSRLHPESFPCNACGATLEMGVVASINADRRPDLRQAVLDDSYQRGRCTACGQGFRLAPELTYVDAARGQWLLVRPAEHLAEWAISETVAQQIFDRGYGARASADARALGAGLQARLVFGWAAFREKLLCSEHGLNDLQLELTKLAVMRHSPSLPMADDIDLRLTAAATDTLTLSWALSGGDLVRETLTLPRIVYDDIGSDMSPAWAEARNALSAGNFVDLNRLLVPADTLH